MTGRKEEVRRRWLKVNGWVFEIGSAGGPPSSGGWVNFMAHLSMLVLAHYIAVRLFTET